MNSKEVKKFEKLLLTERERLSEGLHRIEESNLYQPASEGIADAANAAEVGTDHFERETALNIASGESERLQQINEALTRVHSGTYGNCQNCDKEIAKKRLEAFPAARYCIECQSKVEREQNSRHAPRLH